MHFESCCCCYNTKIFRVHPSSSLLSFLGSCRWLSVCSAVFPPRRILLEEDLHYHVIVSCFRICLALIEHTTGTRPIPWRYSQSIPCVYDIQCDEAYWSSSCEHRNLNGSIPSYPFDRRSADAQQRRTKTYALLPRNGWTIGFFELFSRK